MNSLEMLKEYVKKELESAPGCHDWDHTSRVLHNAKIIADGEMKYVKPDMGVIEAAALLHDIKRVEELEQNGQVCHAELAAAAVPAILTKLGFTDGEQIKAVAEAVRRHRFRGENAKPETIEQKIIFDADKLDSIGAVGVGRAIHFSGRIGSRLHNSEEEALAADAYSEDDSAYREYLVKLRHIPGRMLTATGKKLAEERAEFMHDFFEELSRETSVKDKDLNC